MNTKQLFFFSLIILSIAMGVNWFKNRPKTVVKKQPTQTRQAVKLKDLQLQEKETEIENDDQENEEEDHELNSRNKKYEGEVHDNEDIDKNKDNNEDNNNEDNNKDDNKKDNYNTGSNEKEDINNKNDNFVIASATSEVVTQDSNHFIVNNPLKEDPLMQEFLKITKNSFEISPYAKLVEKIKQEEEKASKPVVVEKKIVKAPKIIGNMRFTGTIETERGPKAIVDGSLYEKGNDLKGYIVKEIKNNLIFLVMNNDDYLLPKTGVQINIDPQTGEYEVEDSYKQ